MSATPIIRYISPKEAIRVALGKLGYSNLWQQLEPDLVMWAMFAANKIDNDKVMKAVTVEATVEDNRVPHCQEFKAVECVKKGGCALTLRMTKDCETCVTRNCRTTCCGNPYGQTFTVNECFIQFSPALTDGTELEITYLTRPIAEDGYPAVPDVATEAIAQYVMWQLLFRDSDPRTMAAEQRWYQLLRQVQKQFNGYTQQQIEAIGLIWRGIGSGWVGARYGWGVGNGLRW